MKSVFLVSILRAWLSQYKNCSFLESLWRMPLKIIAWWTHHMIPLHCSWHQTTLTALKERKVLFLSFPLCCFPENGVRTTHRDSRTLPLNKTTTTNKIHNETQISKGISMSRCTDKEPDSYDEKWWVILLWHLWETHTAFLFFHRHPPEEAECLFQHIFWGKYWVLYEAQEHEVFVGFTWTICQHT